MILDKYVDIGAHKYKSIILKVYNGDSEHFAYECERCGVIVTINIMKTASHNETIRISFESKLSGFHFKDFEYSYNFKKVNDRMRCKEEIMKQACL